jgi:hypothetical protein
MLDLIFTERYCVLWNYILNFYSSKCGNVDIND